MKLKQVKFTLDEIHKSEDLTVKWEEQCSHSHIRPLKPSQDDESPAIQEILLEGTFFPVITRISKGGKFNLIIYHK
jgi:hypothetical protein